MKDSKPFQQTEDNENHLEHEKCHARVLGDVFTSSAFETLAFSVGFLSIAWPSS